MLIDMFIVFKIIRGGILMKIKNIKVGYLECNCYILEVGNKVLIVDPGDEYDKIKKELEGKEVLGILNTHSHFDHIGCIDDLVRDYDIEVYNYENLEEKEYSIGPFRFEVIYTLGHSVDSITFYFKKEKVMFTGDFLFYDTIGRCDLEGGNFDVMKESIDKIKKYNFDIIVYPGHGIKTTLEREFKNNSYFL